MTVDLALGASRWINWYDSFPYARAGRKGVLLPLLAIHAHAPRVEFGLKFIGSSYIPGAWAPYSFTLSLSMTRCSISPLYKGYSSIYICSAIDRTRSQAVGLATTLGRSIPCSSPLASLSLVPQPPLTHCILCVDVQPNVLILNTLLSVLRNEFRR